MKKLLIFSALLCAIRASAATIHMDAEVLKTADGTPMPTTGLIVLTAGFSGSFTGPTATSFTGIDEILLMKWDLSSFETEGVFSDVTIDLQVDAGWNAGVPLMLYWYPTLTLDSTEPGLGTSFGQYSDALGIDGSAPWVMPAAAETVSLKFFTADATFLSAGGSNSADAGRASLTVEAAIPEPSSVALLCSGALLLARRRRRLAA